MKIKIEVIMKIKIKDGKAQCPYCGLKTRLEHERRADRIRGYCPHFSSWEGNTMYFEQMVPAGHPITIRHRPIYGHQIYARGITITEEMINSEFGSIGSQPL